MSDKIIDSKPYGRFESLFAESNVKFVKNIDKSEISNFNDIIFQKALKPEDRKSVLVFFAGMTNDSFSEQFEVIENNVAFIFKMLAQQLSDDIDFIVFYNDAVPQLSENSFAKLIEKFNLQSPPSIAMYASFDVLKGQNIFEEMIQIDMIAGGPSEDNMPEWFNFIANKWILTNLLEPNGKYVWRFDNSSEKKKIKYSF